MPPPPNSVKCHIPIKIEIYVLLRVHSQQKELEEDFNASLENPEAYISTTMFPGFAAANLRQLVLRITRKSNFCGVPRKGSIRWMPKVKRSMTNTLKSSQTEDASFWFPVSLSFWAWLVLFQTMVYLQRFLLPTKVLCEM